MPKNPLHESQTSAEHDAIFLKGIQVGLQIKNKLSCKQYKIFFKKVVEKKSTPVIADIMELTESTVRVQLYRIRKKINKIHQNL